MREKLAAFQNSRAGQFLKKVMDDRAPNLAVLLAWGTLNTLFPLVLGILAIAGFILRDPQRLDQLTSTLFAVLPQEAATALSTILTTTRESAGAASVVSILLLLFSGSNFFANMEMVFDIVYHVQDRNIVMQRVLAVVMLLIVTALLLISTTAYGLGNLIGSLPIGLPVGPVLGRIVGWSISIISAIVMFLLLYKILPNKPQGWRQTLPGALAAAVLFFVILQVFPLYMSVFGKGFQAYAAFGVFLLLMFWLYLLGLVLVIGAEFNAFLEEPGRSTALAEATSKAQKGQVDLGQTPGNVEAVATGSATAGGTEPNATGGARPLFGGARSTGSISPQPGSDSGQRAPESAQRVGIGGRLIGLVGLLGAAFLLSRQSAAPETTPKQD
ncbi:MAG: YihY/virulence factor BrkB family protein [Chloroflexi bacterium]|nr:YihY/virulence factor BrkB family protein [Chloroflexota bacterium]